jgi:hypothetical protein
VSRANEPIITGMWIGEASSGDLRSGFEGASLVSAEAIELQGRPGAQFSIDLTRGGAPQYYLSRVFTDGTNLYQVYYLGGTIGPTGPNVLAFFDSLQLPEGG